MMDFKNKRVHFVGIGGISLSALAIFVLERGGIVSGSDLVLSAGTKRLERLGCKIVGEHKAENVCGADFVVCSGAIDESNPEIVEARELKIPIIDRAECLAEIASEYTSVIAIAGSHGKTTTTGMVASCLVAAGLDPTVHIGGEMQSIGGNFRLGGKSFFVTEACEYKDSFLRLKNQTVSCALNVQSDHMDYFKTIKNLQKSFKKYLKNTNKNGFCVINADDEFLKSVECEAKIISYGIESRDCFVRAKNIRECRWAKHSFDLFVGGKKISRVRLSVSGKHQIYNALSAVCVCVALGICDDAILSGIENFSGIKRRFEDIGTLCGAKVFHDYAHHPTEIQANIKAAEKFTKGKLFVVFQPHTFSRTRDLWEDFLHCFDGADEICIFKIYPAREEPIDGIDEMHLSKEIDSIRHNCFCSNSFDDLFERLKEKLSNGDTLLILGAGDINAFCDYIKEKT